MHDVTLSFASSRRLSFTTAAHCKRSDGRSTCYFREVYLVSHDTSEALKVAPGRDSADETASIDNRIRSAHANTVTKISRAHTFHNGKRHCLAILLKMHVSDSYLMNLRTLSRTRMREEVKALKSEVPGVVSRLHGKMPSYRPVYSWGI